MDEIVVRIARAIASHPRLRVLARLAQCPEVSPTALAAETGMPLSTLSGHLHSLAAAGLILRRRSGAWCYYRAGSPYSEEALSGKLAAWLRSLLADSVKSVDNLGLQEVRDCAGDPEMILHEAIFEAATAFTDVRRLRILRRLDTEGEATSEQLGTELSMSDQAVSRQTAKLRRRGYVEAHRSAGGTLTHSLNPPGNTAVHRRMFEIVRRGWQ